MINSAKPSVALYKDMVSLRRSSRHGLRRSHRHAHKAKRDRKADLRPAVYDRDMGGYNAWGPKVKRTKREKTQLKKERELVEKLSRKRKKTKSGYAKDGFVTADEGKIKKNTFSFDTDDVLDRADAQLATSGSDTDCESDLDWDSC
jgi:glutamate synthase domain-containing protein 2